jgi:hypothetical protein
LAPVPKPTDGEKSLSNPTGENPRLSYSVQIDQHDPVAVSSSAVHWIDKLDLRKRHSVVILANGKPLESFHFTFSQHDFRNQDKQDLCLFLNSFYLTWQLWPVERTGKWCPCWSSQQK